MASRRRAPARRPRTRRGGFGLPSVNIPPDVVRSLVGLTLLVLGVVTLIMLALPSEKGTLTDWARTVVLPNFGTGRWLLPLFLLVAGGLIEWRPLGPGWRTRLVAAMIAYAALLGLFEFLPVRGGGRIGTFLADVIGQLITRQGAFVVLTAIFIGGILITANLRLAEFVHPFRRGIGSLGAAVSRAPEASARSTGRAPGGAVADRGSIRSSTMEPDATATARRSPAPVPSEAPMSQTVVSGGLRGGVAPRAGGGLRNGAVAAVDLLEAEDGYLPDGPDWVLPPIDLLTIVPDPPVTTTRANHADNIRIIEDKLNSFGIPATVVATNTGPVVTQYEVRPERHIKLSRIEGLADDLAMALAARTIRIEAPIPGKDVVGIEIPNVKSEIVSFRRLLEESKMLDAESPLSFALGRDVSGKAYAVDLAKMPHLLVAGATGSGKSVCINALITSILMHAKPEEVRLILIDLKRVELAPYDKLPHLLQPVIVEPNKAKAALNGAVRQMEERYKALAGMSVRNIAAFNEHKDVAPEERLPYIVIIIDELADLIMREGQKVEEPIVKIAQKARAV
ncbi:MAG TPA: DNA translocase FtsK, partial [Candidatus Limnocylindrales bacterium]